MHTPPKKFAPWARPSRPMAVPTCSSRSRVPGRAPGHGNGKSRGVTHDDAPWTVREQQPRDPETLDAPHWDRRPVVAADVHVDEPVPERDVTIEQSELLVRVSSARRPSTTRSRGCPDRSLSTQRENVTDAPVAGTGSFGIRPTIETLLCRLL